MFRNPSLPPSLPPAQAADAKKTGHSVTAFFSTTLSVVCDITGVVVGVLSVYATVTFILHIVRVYVDE